MAEQQQTEAQSQQAKRNKDGFIPGQRLSAQDLANHRNKQRKAAKKAPAKAAPKEPEKQ